MRFPICSIKCWGWTASRCRSKTLRWSTAGSDSAMRWLEIAPKRAVLVASRDDHMQWASSNEAAFKSGAYFATRKNTIELPRSALAAG